MKILHIDWGGFLGFLEPWQSLPLTARALLLDTKPKSVLPRRAVGAGLAPLLEGGFLTAMADGERVQVADAFHESHKVLRSFARHPLLDHPDPRTLREYLGDHFTNEERAALDDTGRIGWDHDAILLATVTSVGHVRGFLHAEDRRAWEKARLPEHHWSREQAETQSRSLLTGKDAAADLARLVEMLAAAVEPIPFRALAERIGSLSRARLGNAIEAGLRYLLLFPAFDAELVPLLTLWPGVAERLSRKPAPPPAPAVPEEAFCMAFQMEDLTQLLVRAAEPLRVKANEWTLFVAAQRELERGLLPLPEWLIHARLFPENAPAERVRQAMHLARLLGFVTTSGKPGRDLGLVTAPAGWQWLDRSQHERLQVLLELRRPKPDVARAREGPGSGLEDGDPALDGSPFSTDEEVDEEALDELEELDALLGDGPEDDIVPFHDAYSDVYSRRSEALSDEVLFGHSAGPSLARVAIGAYASLEPGRPVLFTDFLRYHAEATNPFLDLEGPARKRVGGHWRPATEELLEELWIQGLQRIFHLYLLPLGGASVGIAREGVESTGGLTLELTSVGRYLLGLASDFRFEAPALAKSPLRVQPDFEVVFVARSPALEAALGRFAERRGTGVGVLFRITRESILRAAQSGLGADEVIATLASASATPVPANVEHEVRAWSASCRRLRLEPARLVRCPDAATAARILAAAGAGKLEALSETVLALTDPAHKADVVRACRKAGLFLVDAFGAQAPDRRRSRRP